MRLSTRHLTVVALFGAFTFLSAQSGGEIQFKNGKKQGLTSISVGFRDEIIHYFEDIADCKGWEGFSTATIYVATPSIRRIEYSAVAKIDFLEMAKGEIIAAKPITSLWGEVRKANILLRDGKKLSGVFIPFVDTAKWHDGALSGALRDPKIVSLVFPK